MRYLHDQMFKYTIALMLILTGSIGYSQNATKYSNEFLQIGVGARSLGMGGAIIASTNDVYSGYWNPAGLTNIKNNAQISLMHAAYFAGIANYDYGAWAAKTGDKGAIGLSLIRFGIDGIPNTLDLLRNGEIDYTRVTSFNATDFAAIFSYAQVEDFNGSRHVDFSWGGNMKLVRRKIGSFAKSFGFGFDAGIQFKNDKKNWAAGLVIRDVTSTFNSWRTTFTDAQKEVLTQNSSTSEIPKNSLEITLPRIMGGYAKTWESGSWTFLAEIDANMTLDGKRNTLIRTNLISIDPYIGGEIGYDIGNNNHLYFRAGANNYQKYTNKNGKSVNSVMPNVGLGFTFGRFSIDYALTNLSSIGGSGIGLYSNIFSLKLAINRDGK